MHGHLLPGVHNGGSKARAHNAVEGTVMQILVCCTATYAQRRRPGPKILSILSLVTFAQCSSTQPPTSHKGNHTAGLRVPWGNLLQHAATPVYLRQRMLSPV